AAYCWGHNQYGMLGNGTSSDSNIPVAVSTTGVLSGKTVTNISSGSIHSCVVADGLVYCWGHGESGRLGNGGTSIAYTPVAVSTAGVLSGRTVTAVTAGVNHTCGIAGGLAYCWGYGHSGQLGDGVTTSYYYTSVPVAVSTSGVLADKTISVLSAGSTFTCAIADSRAYCWGSGNNGNIGNGTTIKSTLPVVVSPLPAS
ncbi:MAG TPA: RCC1 repeat-containing protein, partial [Candidatus Saccharibacteria bacterium]|nr:RCC1 repeat-containing protein [Candidatus Saccharibacteria bacterium]